MIKKIVTNKFITKINGDLSVEPSHRIHYFHYTFYYYFIINIKEFKKKNVKSDNYSYDIQTYVQYKMDVMPSYS